jgi:hypothetical protein
MGVVTGLARPSLVGLVDVYEVKIVVTVPETRKGVRTSILGDLAGVARETESKIILIVGQIKCFRVDVLQEFRKG